MNNRLNFYTYVFTEFSKTEQTLSKESKKAVQLLDHILANVTLSEDDAKFILEKKTDYQILAENEDPWGNIIQLTDEPTINQFVMMSYNINRAISDGEHPIVERLFICMRLTKDYNRLCEIFDELQMAKRLGDNIELTLLFAQYTQYLSPPMQRLPRYLLTLSQCVTQSFSDGQDEDWKDFVTINASNNRKFLIRSKGIDQALKLKAVEEKQKETQMLNESFYQKTIKLFSTIEVSESLVNDDLLRTIQKQCVQNSSRLQSVNISKYMSSEMSNIKKADSLNLSQFEGLDQDKEVTVSDVFYDELQQLVKDNEPEQEAVKETEVLSEEKKKAIKEELLESIKTKEKRDAEIIIESVSDSEDQIENVILESSSLNNTEVLDQLRQLTDSVRSGNCIINNTIETLNQIKAKVKDLKEEKIELVSNDIEHVDLAGNENINEEIIEIAKKNNDESSNDDSDIEIILKEVEVKQTREEELIEKIKKIGAAFSIDFHDKYFYTPLNELIDIKLNDNPDILKNYRIPFNGIDGEIYLKNLFAKYFDNDIDNKRLIQLFAMLPDHITHVNTISYYFKNVDVTEKRLESLLIHFPFFIKNLTVSIEGKRTGIDLDDYRRKHYFPDTYSTMASEESKPVLVKAMAILNDYVDNGTGGLAFFKGHWNRHHCEAVSTIMQEAKCFDDLLARLKEIQTHEGFNSIGSLARRIRYIELLVEQEKKRNDIEIELRPMF